MTVGLVITMVCYVLPGSLLIPSFLTQGVGRDPWSQLEDSAPWPSKNPVENTGIQFQ